MSNNLTGQYIANTYQNLVQKPDITKEEYFNGLGTSTYINGDPIGTIKMFYPISGTLSDYFQTNGLGVTGSGWHNWAVCDGRNSTPDLRGRFVVGMSNADATDYGYTNTEKNKSEFNSTGNVGGSASLIMDNIPPHRHSYVDAYVNAADGSDVFSSNIEAYVTTRGDAQSAAFVPPGPTTEIQEGASVGTQRPGTLSIRNTGDGTNNESSQDQLTSTPTEFYPSFYTLMYVIKIT